MKKKTLETILEIWQKQMIKKRKGQIRTERRHRNTSTTSIAQKFHLHAILEPPPQKESRPFQIKLHILLSCCSLLRNSPLRSNHNYRKESFEMGGGVAAAGGDGWLFSAMFAQCIAGAADGRGGDRPPQMKRDTCWLHKYRCLCVKPVYELCCVDNSLW